MTKRPPPPRLYGLLARQASIGVILKRGPSRWFQMIKWHTDTDQFEEGQWFRGHIDVHLSGLSPNGELLIYKAYRYGHESESSYGLNKWTAICRPPYFAPLAVWPSRVGGGGHFINDKLVALDGHTTEAHPHYQPQGLRVIFLYDNDEDLSTQIEPNYVQWQYIRQGDDILGFEILFSDKSIESYSRGEIPLKYNRFYVDKTTGHKYELKDTTWADFDQQGRLIFAKQGKLFAGTLEQGKLQLTELADFNGSKPDPQPAPDWAQKW